VRAFCFLLCGILAAQSPPRFGVAVGASTLGAEVQAATAVMPSANVRFGFNAFSYNDTFASHGIGYKGTLNLRSAEVLYDQFIKGPLHVSGGLLIYDGNKVDGAASVPAGQTFTLGGTTYFSQPGNAISGTGRVETRKVSPMVLIGFGNLLPRSAKHFTVNFDVGVVFQGSPNARLRLKGGACVVAGVCLDAATNTEVQTNIAAEQTHISDSLMPFRYYPVVSLTFGYKF
jgi:hypothetical protein